MDIKKISAIGSPKSYMIYHEDPQQLHINTRFNIISLGKSAADHITQVFVSGFILAQKYKMISLLVLFIVPVKSGSGRNIHFTAYNWLYSRLFCLFIKINRSIHYAMVGNRHGTLSQPLNSGNQVLNPAGSIQETVFTVNMQMCKCHLYPTFTSKIVGQYRISSFIFYHK